MHIRTKLILAFFYLVTLIIVTASSAAVGFNQIYDSFLDIFEKNRQWLIDTQEHVTSSSALEVKTHILSQLVEKQQDLNLAKENQRILVLKSGAQLGVLVTVALLSLTFLSIAMQRNILMRLSKLIRFNEALLRGERHLRISLSGNDELSLLAKQLNVSLDRQDELQAEIKGRIGQQRMMILALLQAFGHEVLLMNNAGDILASSLSRDLEVKVQMAQDGIKEWVSKQEVSEANQVLSYRDNGLTLKFRTIGPNKDNVLGFLVEPVA